MMLLIPTRPRSKAKGGAPLINGGVEVCLIGGCDRGGEDLVECRPLNVHSEDGLLIIFRGPSGAVHHLEEPGFDPAHAIQFESPAEVPMFGGELSD